MRRRNNTIFQGFLLLMVLVWLFLTCCSNNDNNVLSFDRGRYLLPVNSEIVIFSDRSAILNHPVPFYEQYKAETAIAIAAFLLLAVIIIGLI